jgi:tetratricopeptide (TPR) repeat protein
LILRGVITLLSIAACLGCGGGSDRSGDRSGGPSGPPSPTAITLPDLANAAESVREQVRQAYAESQRADLSQSDRAVAFGALGKVLLAGGYLDAAETSFVNARTLAPADAQWPYYLGHVYRQRSEPAKAIAAFEQVLAVKPDDVPALVWLGELQLASGKPDAAERPLRRALDLQPRHARAAAALGRAALARRDYASATKYLEQALALEPGASALHYPLSLAYRGANDAAKADEHMKQRGTTAVATQDPLMAELSGLLESASSYDMLARSALGRGDFASAAAHARRGLDLAGNEATLRASLHQRLGTALAQTGDAAGARREFEEAVRTAPAFAPGHYSLGVVMMSEGRTRDAAEHFTAAIRSEPNYVEARVALGDTLRQAQRPEEALVEYRRALELAPANAAARYGEAVALARRGLWVEARDRLVQWVETQGDDPLLTLALARVLAAAPDDGVRDGGRALALALPLLQAMPTIEGAETVAMALAEVGRFDDAAKLQREAIAEMRRARDATAARRLTIDLGLYEKRQPSRTPWRDEPLYGP